MQLQRKNVTEPICISKNLRLHLESFYYEKRESSLPAIFTMLDTANQGKLTPEEFYTLIRSLPDAATMTEQEIDRVVCAYWKQADVNQAGEVSYNEFAHFMKSTRIGSLAETSDEIEVID